MGEQVAPGNTMFHNETVTIPKVEYEKLLAIRDSYSEMKAQYFTLLHERQHDGA